MALYHDMQQLIGNTPLVKLNHIDLPDGANLYAKLELYNPSGSVKDRIGKYMIEDAEKRGILKKGGTIVEATAGNTGLGIAFAALNKGYKIVFVVPTKFSEEKQTLLRALGAEIINTPREGGMLGAWDKAEEIRRSIPGAVTLEQFKNQANPQAHYETTGKEIFEDLNGQIDYLVAGGRQRRHLFRRCQIFEREKQKHYRCACRSRRLHDGRRRARRLRYRGHRQ